MTVRTSWQVGAAVAALVVVAGTAAAVFVSTRREVTTSSAEAYDAYLKGREDEEKLYYRDASAAYAEALAKDPAFVMAMVRLATLSQERDPTRARSLLQGASRFRESVSARERLLLDIYQKALVDKDRSGAEALTAEYLKAYPRGSEGYQLRANQLMRKGQAKEAAEVFGKLLAVNPNYAVAYNNIGYYCMAQGDFQKAEDNLKRYRFLAPDQANPFDSLGELYANTGRYEEAEENLKRALELKPDFVASVGHLGTVAVGRGDFAGAAALYRRAAQLSDDASSSAHFVLAEALCTLETGKRADALAILDANPVLAGEPTERTKSVWEIAQLVRSGIAGEGASALVPNPPAEPGKGGDAVVRDLAFALVRAIEAARKGDVVPAQPLVARDLPAWLARHGEFSYYPYFPMLWTRLADRLGQAGERGEAAEILKAVLARNPRFQPALDARGRIRGEAGAATAPAPGA
jgi:tetratricopeptide (TPR) repeat protein